MRSAIETSGEAQDRPRLTASASPVNEDRGACRRPILPKEALRQAAVMQATVGELTEPVEYLLATTGKQLRSTVVVHSAYVGPRPDDPLVHTGAVAIELFHLATLAHDDVMDDARIRRGAPTLGVVYGDTSSGFVGGALFARASELMAICGREPIRGLARTASAACVGQMLEFEDLFDINRSVERYREAIAGKTASVFELAAWLGSSLAGAEARTIEVLAEFGRGLGMTFQIADDILDLLAAENETGKPRGADLRQGVYTLPVIRALETDAALRRWLDHAVADLDVDAFVDRVACSSGMELAMRECLAHAEAARLSLRDGLGQHAPGIAALMALLGQAVAPITERCAPQAVEVG